MHIWGAIFDWDGVILDSSRAHERAWHWLAESEGRCLAPRFFLECFGRKNENIIPELLGWTEDPAEIARLSERKEEFYREVLREEGAVPLPGVVPWLQTLASGQIACAIGSSTCRQNIECVIDRLGVRRYFRAMVSGEEVILGKPDPGIFLLAARRLGFAPERCVVFEDAHVGIEAGLAAGMRVVAVASTNPAASLGKAHRVVDRLDELSLDEISGWLKI